MSINVFYGSTDITNLVVGYTWEKNLCNGIGVAKVVLATKKAKAALLTPGLFDIVEIVEDTVGKGKYYIHTIDINVEAGTTTLNAQDGSIKMKDFFVSATYFVDYPSTTGYWIDFFLNEATINHSFGQLGSGSPLPQDTTLGLSNVDEIVTTLLQQSGWYLTFDAEDVARISRISFNVSPSDNTLPDTQIISLTETVSDKTFRNRIIINGYELDWSGRFQQEYSGSNGKDKRTVLIAGVTSPSVDIDHDIAYRAMQEFSSIYPVYTAEVAGAISYRIGDPVNVDTVKIKGTGIVTTIGATCTVEGLISHVVLNEKCPRLFAYSDYPNDPTIYKNLYVYIGTSNWGVWRKPLGGTQWQHYSDGITDMNIVDLAVENGVLGCTTGNGLAYYRHISQASWTLIPSTAGSAKRVTKKNTAGSYGLQTDMVYSFTVASGASEDGTARSNLAFVSSPSDIRRVNFVDELGNDGYEIIDIEANSHGLESSNVVCAVANYSGEIVLWNSYSMSSYDGPDSTDRILQEGGYLALSPTYETTQTNITHSSVHGDGLYLYDARGGDDGSPNTLIRSIYTAVSGVTVSGVTFNDLDVAYFTEGAVAEEEIHSDNIATVGNNSFAVAYTTTEGVFVKVINKTTGRVKRTKLQYSNRYILGTAFRIVLGRRRFYILLGTLDSTTISLVYFDIDAGAFQPAGTTALPSTLHGGTFGYSQSLQGLVNTNLGGTGAATDDDIVFVIWGAYSFSPFDSRIPIIISHVVGAAQLEVNTSVSATPYGANGWPGVDSIYIIGGGLVGRTFYLAYGYTTVGDVGVETVYRVILPTNVGGTSTYTKSPGTFYQTISGRNYFYLAETVASTTRVLDGNGGVFTSIPGTDADLFFVKQPDDADGSIFVVNYSNANPELKKYTTSGYAYSYEIGIKPDYTTLGGFTPSFSHHYSTGALVYDSFYINLVTRRAGSFRQSEVYLLPLPSGITFSGEIVSSGVRLSPVDFTQYVKDERTLLFGIEEGGTYTYVKDVSDPVFLTSLDITQTFGLTYPYFIGYGTNSYSGIIISGYATGFENGIMYTSHGGEEFNIANPGLLHEGVSDAALFGYTIINDVVEGEGELPGSGYYTKSRNRFVLYPQKSDLGTKLFVVDLTMLESYTTIGSGQYYTLENFPGIVNHVETTNLGDYPYIFASGPGRNFYQKDKYAYGETRTSFTGQVGDLPVDVEITIIRVDDKI